MISPHQRHACQWVKESDAVVMYLETSFYETLFPKGMTEVSLSLPVASQDLALWRVANAMRDIYGAHNPGESRTLLLLGAALSHHVVELLHHTMPEPVRRLADDLVRKVEEFVTARMGHPIQAKDIANHVGYSVPHFTNLFKAATGITPAEYLYRRRMKKADELLRTGSFTIGEVGEKVGYSDQGHFAEIFLDHWGYSPRHAIQQARVESANRPKIS
jgi:AraC family transcriptional regulator